MRLAIALLLVGGAAARAALPAASLQQTQETCAFLEEAAAALRTPYTRTEWAERAAWLAAHVDYPVALATIEIDHAAARLGRHFYTSGDEQLADDALANLVPPPAFLSRCHGLRTVEELRAGALIAGRVDYARGDPAVFTDGETVAVTWRHLGFPYLFQLTLRRDAAGRFRIAGTRAWAVAD